MKVTWLGHSAFRVEVGSAIILIDPFLKGNPSFEAADLTFDAATAGTTHVALTHGHDDHIGDTVEICKTHGATLFGVFELTAHLGSQGVESTEPMNTGGSVTRDGFKLTLTDALHSSSSGGVYLGNPCGVVIRPEGDAPTLYHMGDTDVFPGMQLINELHQPDIGLVPIGDRFTMGAEGAAYACRTFFRFRDIVPCHFGTFPIIDATADTFVGEMKGQRVHTPKIGEALDL